MASMDRKEAIELLDKRRNAWLVKDLDTYLSLFAEDFVFIAGGVEQTPWKSRPRKRRPTQLRTVQSC